MNYAGSAPVRQPELPERDTAAVPNVHEVRSEGAGSVLYMRLLWKERRLLARIALYAFLVSIVMALLIPVRFESTARLMPPDNQSASGLATAVAAMSGGSGGSGGLGGIATDFLGLKSTSDIFVGILSSRTA